MQGIVGSSIRISIFEFQSIMKRIFYLLFLLSSFDGRARVNLDSLLKVWNDTSLPDTTRLNAMTDISFDGYIYSDPDSAYYYAELQYQFATKVASKKYQAQALNTQGTTKYFKGDYVHAIDLFTRSLKIRAEIGDKRGEASCINNMGAIYMDMKETDKALECYKKSLKIREELGDKDGMAASYNNLGAIYAEKKENTLAIEFYTRSLRLREELGDKIGIATVYNNMGTIYVNLKDVRKAREYFSKGLAIREEMNDRRGQAMSHYNIGSTYQNAGDIKTAIVSFEKGLKIASESEAVLHMNYLSLALFKCYKSEGRYKESLEMYELYVQMNDSINNVNAQKEVMKQEMQYEYEKQKAVDEKEREKETAIAAEQKQKQKVILYAISCGLLLVIAFAAFVVNRLRVTRKQKNIIDEKQKEILSSIHYAKRIQQSLLPKESYIDKNLKRLSKDQKP